MGEKRSYDIEAMGRDYRAGILSLREVGDAHGVSHVGVRKIAEREGWTRDLNAKIRARADALVSKEAVTAFVSTETKVAEKEIVEANASIQAQIRREQRTDIQRTKRIANKLMEQLEALALPVLPEAGSKEKLLAASAAMIGILKEHSSVLKQLTDTQRVAVNMEREAFGIAQMVAPDETGAPQQVDPIEAAKRMAFVLQRAGHLIAKG